ncbi:Zinc/iron permease [Sporormia fimetaria CBS 119925]|uniref:Zinc/iron permease n=1 Tax=Sporormia fimetaria CBS 119925 TaxID=1340428 RepID=A0A6A6V1Z1_9PLEO|nr:Zinc/iron permease [Sporormia fimetaria CBS 119925]
MSGPREIVIECPSSDDIPQLERSDVLLKVAAIFIVFAASALGCGFPVVAKKVKSLRIPPKVFFFCKHFGTGVLIATAFVHLVPVAFQSLNNPCLPEVFTEGYAAMPGVIMMGALFVLFLIEMWLNAKTGGHSHGSATGEEFGTNRPPPPGIREAFDNPLKRTNSYDSELTMAEKKGWVDEKRAWVETSYPVDNYPFSKEVKTELEPQSEMPPWFIVFYEQYIRQRDEMLQMIQRTMPVVPQYSQQPQKQIQEQSFFDDDVEPAVDPMVLKKQSMQITLIEGGILFHSIFVGMTISITTDGFITLLVAIIFHQAFEGLGLGSRIAAVPYPSGSWRPWLLVMAFGTTCPIGQAIGLATAGQYNPDSPMGLILVGTFNAISSGLLLYAALVDLLAEDFLSEEAQHTLTKADKTKAFCYLLLGAAGMSVVGAFA